MSRELMLHDPPNTPLPPPCAPPPTPESYFAKEPVPSPFSVSRRRKLRREARALEARRTVLEQSIATAQADLKHVSMSLATILGRVSECAKPTVRLGQDLVMDVVPMGLDDVVARKMSSPVKLAIQKSWERLSEGSERRQSSGDGMTMPAAKVVRQVQVARPTSKRLTRTVSMRSITIKCDDPAAKASHARLISTSPPACPRPAGLRLHQTPGRAACVLPPTPTSSYDAARRISLRSARHGLQDLDFKLSKVNPTVGRSRGVRAAQA